jgi:hypothetical protein
MQFSVRVKAAAVALVVGVSLGATSVRAGDVLAEISVRNTGRPSTYHGEMFVFPETVRDYTPARFYGWSFRNRLRSGGMRQVEVDRARTRGAYLMVTDLFPDGHFSTMSHTVLMVFPRNPIGRTELYALSEDRTGNLRLQTPNGSSLLFDGATHALLPTADFSLAPQGTPGTPPDFRHRGLHLVVHSVGKSPFLRRTPVRAVDAMGRSCLLTTDEIFAYGPGPESDVFRFDSDAQFFRYLAVRCPNLEPAPGDWRTAAVVTDGPAPILVPAASVTVADAEATDAERSSSSGGGVLRFFASLLSGRVPALAR